MPPCNHLSAIRPVVPSSYGCEDCLAAARRDLFQPSCVLRQFPRRHAKKHFFTTAHPAVRSFEPGEDWFWCYVDETVFELAGAAPAPSHP